MAIEFDPAKDETNQARHGLSLSQALNIDIRAVVADDRKDYGEARFLAFGFLDGVAVSLAFTYRGENIRPISLRRAHAKEMARYVPR